MDAKTFVLKEKLKMLKVSIKQWNAENFGDIEEKIKNLQVSIIVLDEKAEVGSLSEIELESRRALFAKLRQKLRDKESLFRQKWFSEGDVNTVFFHVRIAVWRRKNQMVAIMVNDLWLEDLGEIRKEVRNYFEKMYFDSDIVRSIFYGVDFIKLAASQIAPLLESVTFDELEDAVQSCNGNKVPGSDGSNFNFVKKFWGTIKEDVWGMIQEFFGNAKLPKGFTAYFMSLIPKCNNPQWLDEYRRFSLVGCIYKFMAKLLVVRLTKVLCTVISHSQSTFLPRRNILHGILVIDESGGFCKKIGKGMYYI